METRIETERIILRPMLLEDALELFRMNADPEVLKYTGDQAFGDIIEAEKFISEYIKEQEDGFGRYTMIRKADQAYLGWCGLKDHGDLVDLGFRIQQKHWGNGYASEASIAMLEHGFRNLELEEITGRAAQENLASIAILKKLGMTLRGEEECHGIPNAQIYSIHKWEYLKDSNG